MQAAICVEWQNTNNRVCLFCGLILRPEISGLGMRLGLKLLSTLQGQMWGGVANALVWLTDSPRVTESVIKLWQCSSPTLPADWTLTLQMLQQDTARSVTHQASLLTDWTLTLQMLRQDRTSSSSTSEKEEGMALIPKILHIPEVIYQRLKKAYTRG